MTRRARALAAGVVLAACASGGSHVDRMATAYDGAHVLGEILGDDEAALRGFRDAARIEPRFAEAHHNAGVALVRLERPREALASFRRAAQEKPGFAAAHAGAGLALADLGRMDEALAEYESAARLQPDAPERWADVAVVSMAAGRHAAAAAAFDRAEGLAPGWFTLHPDQGALRAFLGAAPGAELDAGRIGVSDVRYCPPFAALRDGC